MITFTEKNLVIKPFGINFSYYVKSKKYWKIVRVCL